MALTVSDLKIVEVDGPRRLELKGRALPFRRPRFGNEAISAEQNFQGNPERVIQIISNKAMDTEITGRWKTQFLDGKRGGITYTDSYGAQKTSEKIRVANDQLSTSETESYGQAEIDLLILEVCEFISELVASGARIDMTWMGKSRRGIIKSFWYEPNDQYDIHWGMKFLWTSYRQNESSENNVEKVFLPEYSAKDWADRVEDLVGYLEAVFGFSPSEGYDPQYKIPLLYDAFDVINSTNEQIGRANSALESVERLNETVSRAALTPVQTARQVLQMGLSLKSTLSDMAQHWGTEFIAEFESWDGMFDQYQGSVQPNRSEIFTAFGDVPLDSSQQSNASVGGFSSQVDNYEAYERINQLLYEVEKSIIETQKNIRPQIKDAIFSKEGQHMGAIARTYYGNFDSWPLLAEYNDIQGPVLDGNTLVLIPVKLTTDMAAI